MKMYVFILLFCILSTSVRRIDSKNWFPHYPNESTFDEPFDYVNDYYLPNLLNGEKFDWISTSGTTLPDIKRSYIAFTGTRKNNANNYSSVFTKEIGVIVLCESVKISNQTFNLNINCKLLEQKSLRSYEGIYFGAVVRSVKYTEDTAAFIYCDPLWFDEKWKFKDPTGKCYLTFIKDFAISKRRELDLSLSYERCLGGFSVDIFSHSQNVDVMFGLPFCNSTLYLKQAQYNSIAQVVKHKGNFFNFGYSVSFADDGNLYVSSPVSDGNSAFVQMVNGEKFYPKDKKTQNYGGFGTSLDTVKVNEKLYGAVIGAPYQNKQDYPNVGAVFLACKGFETDMVMGESKYDYFGYSVARIGDIDYDGSDEFAVSAPSLNFDKPAKLYIYKTSRDCKIQKKPLQIYQSNVKGFGISISRGFDIDYNGWPDFFVTSLNASKPFLFKMPDQKKVVCVWYPLDNKKIFLRDETFDVNIYFQTDLEINFNDYFYQIALDFENKDEKRFELVKSALAQKVFTLKIKTLLDVVDMDLNTIPLKLAIKGTRMCKKEDNDNCFRSTSSNIIWMDSEKTIKLVQQKCNTNKCFSELILKVKPDINGTVIYLGNSKSYLRTLEVIVKNDGPETSSRIFMSVNSSSDMKILDVNCTTYICSPLLPNGQIIIKNAVNSGNEVRILIEVLYIQLKEIKSRSSIIFKIWGINNDSNLSDNHYTVNYTVLFKPNLIFSSNKEPKTQIDARSKPPYLEAFKRTPVHELGTDLHYSYMIENKGPELKNVEFKLKFPFNTENKLLILYLMDNIRFSVNQEWISALPKISRNDKEAGRCYTNPNFINPLKVIAVETHKHEDPRSPGKSNRLKRSIIDGQVVTYINNHNDSINIDLLSKIEKASNISPQGRSTNIDCNITDHKLGLPICGEVICTLDIIPMNSVFNFDFRAWLFTKSFFDARIADLIVTTSIESNLGDLPLGVSTVDGKNVIGPFSISQKVVFSKMIIPTLRPLSLWPIILAIVIGIILLAIIIIIAYYCGFFKRKRLRQELKKKRENNRLKNESSDKIPLNSS